MIIYFTYPELPHPNSPELTILELAKILESKYHVLENFVNRTKPLFIKKLYSMYKQRGKLNQQVCEEWLKAEWREYIISGKAGFTVASHERGDPAFVQTSAYYLGMQPKLSLSRAERKKYFK